MNLFDRFKTSFAIESFEASYQRNVQADQPDWLVFSLKSSLPLGATNVALCDYCLGNHNRAREYASYSVEHTLEYFFGKWRGEVKTGLGTFDPNWWRINAAWMQRFQESICWASALGDWKTVGRLATYPVKQSKAGVDGKPEDAAFYFALACYLRQAPLSEYEDRFGIIAKGKKQKPKLLAEVLRSLLAADQKRFQATLEEYLQYFRKSEFKKSSIDKLLSFDATIMINVVKKRGLEFKIPPEVEDHILRL